MRAQCLAPFSANNFLQGLQNALLIDARPPVVRHSALETLGTEDGPGDIASFSSLIDPQSVIDLMEIAETLITEQEAKALHRVGSQLGDCIRRPTAEGNGIAITGGADRGLNYEMIGLSRCRMCRSSNSISSPR